LRRSEQRASRRAEIGILIAWGRKLRGMTKVQLAAKAGVEDTDISRWERGGRLPGKQNLDKVLAAAGIPWSLAEALLLLIRFLRTEEGVIQPATPDTVAAALDSMRALTPALLLGIEPKAAPPSPESQRQTAEELFERLAILTPRERRLLVEKSPRFQTEQLAARLYEASRDAAAASEPLAREYADLALEITRRAQAPGA
jgi:transcriptional regulator with XRE-family HTH domain